MCNLFKVDFLCVSLSGLGYNGHIVMDICTEIEHSNKKNCFNEHYTNGNLRPKTGIGLRRPTRSPFIILIIVLIVVYYVLYLSGHKLHNNAG